MKSLIKLFSYLGSVLLICAVVSACAPTKPIVDSTTWLIAPKRVGETRKANSDFWLKMGAVSVNSPFDSKSMVYRLSDQRYEKDFYNGYISTPAEMIGNATRQWLADATIFRATLNQSNTFFSYYTLEANVKEFYGDYRSQGEAVVSMEFYLAMLSSGSQNPFLMTHRYTQRVALNDNRPDSLAKGLEQATSRILQAFEQDLYMGTRNLPKPLGQQKLLSK